MNPWSFNLWLESNHLNIICKLSNQLVSLLIKYLTKQPFLKNLVWQQNQNHSTKVRLKLKNSISGCILELLLYFFCDMFIFPWRMIIVCNYTKIWSEKRRQKNMKIHFDMYCKAFSRFLCFNITEYVWSCHWKRFSSSEICNKKKIMISWYAKNGNVESKIQKV